MRYRNLLPHPTSQPPSTTLTPSDLNPQSPYKMGGIEYLAESSKSRRARAVGVVNKIGRALSITRAKEKFTVTRENGPFIKPISERREWAESRIALARGKSNEGGDHVPPPGRSNQIKPLRHNLTGPRMTPLRSEIVPIPGRHRSIDELSHSKAPQLPLRSRQSWQSDTFLSDPPRLSQSTHTPIHSLYNSQWNHSRQALSLFDIPLTSSYDSTNDDIGGFPLDPPASELGSLRPYQPSSLSAHDTGAAVGGRSDLHTVPPPGNIADNFTSSTAIKFNGNGWQTPGSPKRPLPTPPSLIVTPIRRQGRQRRRKAVPSFNDSSDSLLTSPSTPKAPWQPLKMTRGAPLLQMNETVNNGNDKGIFDTPPTPNFGSIAPPSPIPSISTVGWWNSPENSFEEGQDHLYDEVLTSWNLPPLSRSSSLTFDKVPHQQTIHPLTLKKDKLSRSTGSLNTKYVPVTQKEVKPPPTFYPSGRSFEPIRSTCSTGFLRVQGEKEDVSQRKISGKIKTAIEVFEGKRDPSASPPTPFKEMAKLLKRKPSNSSMRLQEETRRMMAEARERKLNPKARSRSQDWVRSIIGHL
ncbi:uncharacterized protein IL334_001793 [Kwoniella shivajii]|uniref:Uncharacterized protein n=1 Tax=Kwoniella shivajii TaxID=564305 RepID=A0ABZ1CX37_9TREE|nr:hypothetical protein IL334_001793 [Kwoniella shivajii]